MIEVTKLRMTCGACPTQWEGFDSEGHAIYVRFRWGHLWVSRSHEPTTDAGDGVWGYDLVSMSYSDALDGFLEYDTLRRLTAGTLTWPDDYDR